METSHSSRGKTLRNALVGATMLISLTLPAPTFADSCDSYTYVGCLSCVATKDRDA